MATRKLMTFAAAVLAASTFSASAADAPMSFFVTSVGSGAGANLGGLDGADAHCGVLAEAAGTTGRTWRAYLSTQEDGKRGVSARYRIGTGPWYNANGELVAVDLDELHLSPNIIKRTAVDENGNSVNGVGDSPNEHDILTGSLADGRRISLGIKQTRPVRTGPAKQQTEAHKLATMTVMAAAMYRGTLPTGHAVVVRLICPNQAALDCSTALQRTNL